MNKPRWIAMFLLLTALAAGTASDRAPATAPVFLGGYRVLKADFHVHVHPLSGGGVAPWDTVVEAQRQGLDVVALTPHNHVWIAKSGRWFSERFGGPTVLVGEEIAAPKFHMLAVGIESVVSWRQPAARAIDEIHSQGGVAIAAHPSAEFWPGYDAEALEKLDGAEVLQPGSYFGEQGDREYREFFRRANVAAIADSDYHGMGPVGLCRTYLFARDNSKDAVLEAIREKRTVVLDGDEAFGDPALIRLAREAGLDNSNFSPSTGGWRGAYSRIAGILGMLLALGLRPRP